MASESPFKLGLGSKTLSRARLVLGSLLLLFMLFTIAGIHQGVTSGDFDKVFLKPFREFAADLDKATKSLPDPTFSPSSSASAIVTPAPVKRIAPVVQPAPPVASNCIRKNIREGEFASDKCYSEQDFEDLNYYLQRYNSAVFNRDSADSSMRITCSCRVQQECDFFQDSCEKDKQQKSQAESDINKYRGIIQGIIAKGK